MRKVGYFALAAALAALIFCFAARSSLAAQADAKKPPAPSTLVFTLLDSNGKQVGTVVSIDAGTSLALSVVTRVPIQDSTGVTRNLALRLYQGQTEPAEFGTRYFESTDCSGTPFIDGLGGFLTAFDPGVVDEDGTLTIATSTVPQTIVAHSNSGGFGGPSCRAINLTTKAFPGEVAGNIHDMFPPPYTLIAK